MSKLRTSWSGRLYTIATVALTVALALVAGPASAAEPTSAENFSPDEIPATAAAVDADDMILSDRPDGSTTSASTFHATTVTTTDAVLVEFHLCDSFADNQAGSGAGADPNLDGDCLKLGEDTTGVIPSPGPAGAGKAFEAELDIPANKEDLTPGAGGDPEFVTWICTSTTRTDANCDSEVEENVNPDDSSTPANPPAQSSAGEITSPPHGSSVSNAGFIARASTSPDVTNVTFCIAQDAGGLPGDPADEGQAADDGDPFDCLFTQADDNGTPDNPPSQQSTFKTWSARLGGGTVPDNAEFALVVFEGDSANTDGAGLCAGDGDCQLDSHYLVSAIPTPTTAVLAWPDEGATQDEYCMDNDQLPNQNAVPNSTGMVGEAQWVQGCIFDQSGVPITDDINWAFQATPDSDAGATSTNMTGFNAGYCLQFIIFFCISEANEGDENDLNANNFSEMVDGDGDGDPDANGGDAATSAGITGAADQSFQADAPGVYTVTFCVDANNDAEDANPAQSPTPCAGEALSVSGTKTFFEDVDHVHVKRQDQTDALCHTGASTTTAPAGSSVTLRGCTLAVIPSTGDEIPVGDVHVIWITNPLARPDDPGQITSQTNTSDNNGQATATVTAPASGAEKTSTIRFCVDEFPATGGAGQGNGICDAAEAGSGAGPGTQADYQINWTGAAAGACTGFNRIRGNNENNLLIGTGDCDRIKARGGDDTSRGKGGNDVLNGGRGRDKGNGGPGTDKCVKTEKKRRCELGKR
jgi:hypothetical protein